MSQPVWRPPRSQPQVVSSGTDEWSSGICDCCQDMSECCCGFWCFPCFACKTSKALGEPLCLPLLDGCACVHPVTFSTRVSVRHLYDIRGSMCNDCVTSTFCWSCVWCQMSRENKSRRLPVVLGDIFR